MKTKDKKNKIPFKETNLSLKERVDKAREKREAAIKMAEKRIF